jgi:hypothetical protein
MKSRRFICPTPSIDALDIVLITPPFDEAMASQGLNPSHGLAETSSFAGCVISG